jgi:hypothetical protein
MNELVNMVVICWMAVIMPHGKPMLQEAWRFERLISLENCLIMSHIFTGDKITSGVITVKCGDGFQWKPRS